METGVLFRNAVRSASCPLVSEAMQEPEHLTDQLPEDGTLSSQVSPKTIELFIFLAGESSQEPISATAVGVPPILKLPFCPVIAGIAATSFVEASQHRYDRGQPDAC